MEMPEQEMPVVFSQMLQMFPNIPQNIIWMYVQRYSSDIEKCAQMLNLQSGKYAGLNSSVLDNNKYYNEQDILIQPSRIMPSSKTVFDNNNEMHSPDWLPLISNEVKNSKNEALRVDQQTECSAMSSPRLNARPSGPSSTACESVVPVDSASKFSSSFAYREPLALHVNVDEDDSCLHSWRPNLSADVLCSDFFLPSPMLENFQLNNNHVSNMNIQRSISENHMSPQGVLNPEGVKQKPFVYNTTPVHVYHGYPLQNERAYGLDIASHLYYQKSQMNAVRYEVIKAKIELTALKETEEKLITELKEEMQSKNEHDIVMLNEEIVQLRLECQCLCTEIDCYQNDQVILGEVDEKYYVRNNPSHNTEIPNTVCDETGHSKNGNSSDVVDESQRWPCPQCTFANHPAINVCEMCHISKPRARPPPYLATTPASCYCHPKEETLSVQS